MGLECSSAFKLCTGDFDDRLINIAIWEWIPLQLWCLHDRAPPHCRFEVRNAICLTSAFARSKSSRFLFAVIYKNELIRTNIINIQNCVSGLQRLLIIYVFVNNSMELVYRNRLQLVKDCDEVHNKILYIFLERRTLSHFYYTLF